jgi:serine phosphatase RsbU (regulator of sigma subunit)
VKLLDDESRRALKSGKGIFCLILIVISFLVSFVTVLTTAGQIGQPFAGFRVEPTLTVSAVNEAYWPGPKAGILTYDRIMAMNGKPVHSPAEFRAVLKSTPVGEPITYSLLAKDGKTAKEITVPVGTFTLQDYVRSFLTLFLVGFGHLLVGAIAYLVRPGNPAARAHLYMTLAIGLTTILANDYDTVMFFPRIWLAAVALTGGACLHLGFYFPQKKKLVQKRPWVLWVPYVISFAMLAVWEYAFRVQGLAGYRAAGSADLFDLHFAMNDLSLLWSLGVGFMGLLGMIIHSVIKAESQMMRNQAKVALIGALVAYIPMTVFWLILDQILHIKVSPAIATVCWILFIVFPASVAYAIIKHKMFDIEFVLKQSMTYSALVALLGSGYVVIATGIQATLKPLMTNYSDLTSYMLTTAVVILLFDPLRFYIRSFIDRKFFRKQYDFRTALSDFVDTARSTIDRDDLIPKMVDIMEKTIHPKHILLMLRNPDTQTLQQAYAHGINVKLKDDISAQDPALLSALGLIKRKSLTTRFTSALNINSLNNQGPLPSPIPFLLAKRITSQLPQLEEVEAINNSLTLPLTVKVKGEDAQMRDELIGLLTLGEKRSELEYTIEDRQLFQSIGQQLALTLHSSELAEEVAEKEAIKQNLLKARLIQKSMLPQKEMDLARFEVTGYSESADETGGDYYDWYDLGNGRFVIGVGDVTGHGIDAALIVGMAKSCLYNQAVTNPDVVTVMTALNRTLNDMVSRASDRSARKLMSFVYALFDTDTMTCHMASAGHWFPYHFRAADETLTNFPEFKGSFPLGQRPPEKYKCQAYQTQMQSGDIMVFFTDGLHEGMNRKGQEYSLERVEQLITLFKDASAAELRDRIIKDWEAHIQGHGMDDDVTVVVVKAYDAPEVTAVDTDSDV